MKPKQQKSWHFVGGITSDGDMLRRRVPANTVPCLARLGMVVILPGDSNYAQIVFMTPGFCIVELEDGSSEALRWPEVDIVVVQPDPSQVCKGGVR